MTKFKKLDDNNVKHVRLLILKISFLTRFGFGVNINLWLYMVVLMTQNTYVNHKQTDKQTEIINRVQREHISSRTKLAMSFNWGKIYAIATE